MKTRLFQLAVLSFLALFMGRPDAVRGAQIPQEEAILYLPIVSDAPVIAIPILNVFGYYGGGDVVQGAVRNTSGRALYDVVVELTAYDVNNQVMGTYLLTPTLSASFPGEFNPFGMSFPQVSAENYTAEVVAYSFQSAQEYASVTIMDVEAVETGPNSFLITIEIRNDTPDVLTDVAGYIWVPGEWMVGKPPLIPITPVLQPGETAEYSRSLGYSGWLPPVYAQAQGKHE